MLMYCRMGVFIVDSGDVYSKTVIVSTSTTCPYSVLGVARMASMEDVKRAYRAQVKKYHPDVNPGNTHAASMFRIVQDAYERIERGDVTPPTAPSSPKRREYHHTISLRQAYTGFYARLEGRMVYFRPGVCDFDVISVGDYASIMFGIIREKDEHGYYRRGNDLCRRDPLKITRAQARKVGGILKVEHPFDGTLYVKIDKQVSKNDTLTIFNHGFRDFNTQERGDYVVKLEIESWGSMFNPINATKRYFDWMLTLPPGKLLFVVTLMFTLPFLAAMIIALLTAPPV